MSYEEMSRNSYPCRCGKGTILSILSMDDWNRTTLVEDIQCPRCRKEHEQKQKELARVAQRNKQNQKKAVALAKERYLSRWLETFEGLNKREVWERLPIKTYGYPALGTFYKHVKYHGTVQAYLTWLFEAEIQYIIPAVFKDKEIELLLTPEEPAQDMMGVER